MAGWSHASDAGNLGMLSLDAPADLQRCTKALSEAATTKNTTQDLQSQPLVDLRWDNTAAPHLQLLHRELTTATCRGIPTDTGPALTTTTTHHTRGTTITTMGTPQSPSSHTDLPSDRTKDCQNLP
jgi:hypothetical protein